METKKPHAHSGTPRRTVQCAVITVSDTRTEATDTSGRLICQLLVEAGHPVPAYQIVPDEPYEIRTLLKSWVENPDIEVLIFNGGTGISRRDTTFDVIDAKLDKRLPGFGELFRMLSYDDIGPAALLSRATAGIVKGKFVVSMPGSSGAVRLGMEKLILPELSHIVNELEK